jgi:hypothetical protein
MAEVAGTPAQPDLRIYRAALMVLADLATGTEVSAQSTVTFSQSTDGSSLPRNAGPQTITFSATAAKISTFQPSVTQTVTFSQTVVEQPSNNQTVSNTVTFSQAIATSLATPVVQETLLFSDVAASVGTLEVSASETVTFSHVVGFLGPQVVEQTVTFSHAAGGGLIIPGGIEANANVTVTFSQAVQKVLIKVGATSHSATHTVTFGHRAALPIFLAMQQSVIFSDLAVSEYVYLLEQTVTFDAPVAFTVDRPLLVTHTITFNHAIVFENKIDTCRYSPTIGGGTDPNAPPTPPATFGPVVKASQVTLFYPTTSPTTTVIIRAPEYGDRHRLQFDRINRETRGGTLEVFADPDWPKMEIIEASFTGLKETEAQAVLDFFTLTLGLEVGFIDWHGRTWHGIVTSPDAQLIRARRGIVDLSFEFEGEVQ